MGYPPDTRREYRLAVDGSDELARDWGLNPQLALKATFDDVGEALAFRDRMRREGYPVKVQHRDVTEWVDDASFGPTD